MSAGIYLTELLKPETYGMNVRKVRLVQTHTSWVFLTGDFAYKIKKPVNFGFLDYTTLNARRHFTNEEFRLNRRLAPELYISVLPIIKKGKIIDYALKMKELPQETLMTQLLKKDQVSYPMIDEIARIIAGFHKRAQTNKEISKYGRIATIKYNWDENFAQTKDFIGMTISRKTYFEIKSAVANFINKNRKLFSERIHNQKIRQCHGDLHPKNIFISDKVYIFDCIEFNPRFACCDVASEIAFFIMDLEYNKKSDLANYFLDRYLQLTDDYQLLRLLQFYKSYRAYVRGKVTSFNLSDPGIASLEKLKAKKIARRYFALAHRYTKEFQKKSKLVIIGGLPGVGKTFYARLIAERFNLMHLSSDIIRKELVGVPVDQPAFIGYGKGIYTKEISQKTYETMFERGCRYLENGQPVILDATFSLEKFRKAASKIAQRFGIPFLIIQTTAPERVILKRMAKREKEKSFSDANPLVYFRMKQKHTLIQRKKVSIERNEMNFEPISHSRFHAPHSLLVKIDTSQPISKNLKKIGKALLQL